MAKKKKTRPQMPPLSRLDKGIYYGLPFVLLFLSIFLSPVLPVYFGTIRYSDPCILAYVPSGTPGIFFPGLLLGLLITYPLEKAMLRKQPIFGRRGIDYGPPHYKAIYPLFYKNKPISKEPPEKLRQTRRKKGLFCLAAAILVTTMLLSIAPGASLKSDGSVTVYTSFAQIEKTYHTEDVRQITVSIHRKNSRRGSSRRWYLNIRFVLADGSSQSFSSDDFRPIPGNAYNSTIAGMLQLKALFDSSIISYADTQYLPNLAEEMELTAEETAVLYALFDLPYE